MALDTDSIKGKSSDELKDMLMQTSVPDSGVEEETVEAAEESEESKEEVKTEETTQEVETDQETKAEEEPEEPRYKIKRKGVETELALSKILELAQKGQDYEVKLGKLREEKEKLESDKSATQGIPFDKLNTWFISNVKDKPAETIIAMTRFGVQAEKEEALKEIKEERKFLREKSREFGEIWDELKDSYQDFRDDGRDRETALAMAQSDYYKRLAIKIAEVATKKGEKKGKLKVQAEIPTGEKKTRGSEGILTPEKAVGLPSAELRKHLKYVKTPGF